MVKVSVAYDTKYGNTKLVAENIVSGLKEANYYKEIVYETGNNFDKATQIIDNLNFTETEEVIELRKRIAKESDWSNRFQNLKSKI